MKKAKYRVIKRLEAGGMAEVFLGEAAGIQGFKKPVAIKRVLPHLAQNENFIQMFLDEARLSARLNHANIVSVFDIEPHDETFYLVMEFVDGTNLKRIMDSLQAQGQAFPLGEAAYICMEACRGLSYAHELLDEYGNHVGIVHRDISPPNIMVTKRGEVKVADFGLAKANTQLSQTDPGVVKGKFGYLSPEAAEGLEVDARADIFSLGIVLWEMLAGRRLFLGENDYATVKLVQAANVPRLSPLNSEVDESFEEVLMRALMRDPDQRYQSAQDFGSALAEYLFTKQRKVTSYDLAALVNATTANAGQLGSQDDSLIARLIQEELHEGSAPRNGSPPPSADSSALAGELEDPASWFSEEELALAGDNPVLSPREADVEAPHPGSWRESGLDILELPDSTPPPHTDPAQPLDFEPYPQTAPRALAPTRVAGSGDDPSEPRLDGTTLRVPDRQAPAASTPLTKVILAAAVLLAVVVVGALAFGGRH